MRANGGSMVPGGFYWHRRHWEVVPVSGKRGVLPGAEDEQYVSIPFLALLLIGPIMGGLYVVFLPFIGFAMLGVAAARKLRRSASAQPAEAAAPERPAQTAPRKVVPLTSVNEDKNKARGSGEV